MKRLIALGEDCSEVVGFAKRKLTSTSTKEAPMSFALRIIRTIALPVALTLGLVTLMPVLPVSAGDPCCNVKAVDPKTGMVTLQDLKTGQTFQLKADPKRLKSLQVGQHVDRNIGTPAR
jgi:hypothetical protein